MASTLSDIDEIRRHMAQIRKELHEDVQGVVKGAEAATDWRRYVKNYPWVTTGVAFGLGFLLVPRRQHPPVGTTVNFAHANQARPVVSSAPPAPEPEKKGKGLIKTAIGLATPFVLRTAQGYALQFFEQYLAQKMTQQQSPFANMAASFMNNGGGGSVPNGPPQPTPQPQSQRYPA